MATLFNNWMDAHFIDAVAVGACRNQESSRLVSSDMLFLLSSLSLSYEST